MTRCLQRLHHVNRDPPFAELLSNLVFEDIGSCGDLIVCGDFYSVGERDAGDDFGEIIEAA